MFGCCDFCVFKQKTAYEMRISDWSSDVCSSDLRRPRGGFLLRRMREDGGAILGADVVPLAIELGGVVSGEEDGEDVVIGDDIGIEGQPHGFGVAGVAAADLLVAGIGDSAARIEIGRAHV